MIEVHRCPLCSSERARPFETVTDSGVTLRYTICDHCALVYQNPRLDPESLSSLYETEYRVLVQGLEGPCAKDIRSQLARAHDQARLTSGMLRKVSRHLDIGCSSGALMAVFNQRFGCVSIGVEPGAAYAAFARSKGFRVYADLDDLGRNEAERFDLVTLSHVLEHLVDPVEELTTVRERFMSPGGSLLVEVPNLYGHQSLELTHLTAFSPSSLRDTLRKAGLRIVHTHVHGGFRSRALGLYITAVGRAEMRYRSHSVPRRPAWPVWLRRRLGMAKLRLLSHFVPALAWREPSEAEATWPVLDAMKILVVIVMGSLLPTWPGLAGAAGAMT